MITNLADFNLFPAMRRTSELLTWQEDYFGFESTC